jgi:hypothetical protein
MTTDVAQPPLVIRYDNSFAASYTEQRHVSQYSVGAAAPIASHPRRQRVTSLLMLSIPVTDLNAPVRR